MADITRSLASAPWSTFTHVDRHLDAFRLMFAVSDARPLRLALLGSGPVEPFTVAALAPPGSEIDAFDLRGDFQELTAQLGDGGCPLPALAYTSQDNVTSEGSNRWFEAGAGRLSRGIARVNEAAGCRVWHVDGDRLFATANEDVRINFRQSDVLDIRLAGVDVIWAGHLVTNMRKVHSAERVTDFLARLLSYDVPTGLGTSLSPTFGVREDLQSFAALGAKPAMVTFESLVQRDDLIYGDIAMLFNVAGSWRRRVACTALRTEVLPWDKAMARVAASWAEPLDLSEFVISMTAEDHDRCSIGYSQVDEAVLRENGVLEMHGIRPADDSRGP